MTTKPFIFINEDSKKGEYGWVYINIPGLKNQSLAVEAIEYNTYTMYGNLSHKEAILKEDLIPMPKSSFKEWEKAFCDGEADELNKIVEEVIDAHKVAKALI